jgi:hypothetical protein
VGFGIAPQRARAAQILIMMTEDKQQQKDPQRAQKKQSWKANGRRKEEQHVI